MNDTMFKSKKSLHQPYNQQKSAFCNTGSMYTMCSGGGAQVLMNAPSIVTATRLQFLPPIRHKQTMCSVNDCIPMASNTIYFQETGKFPTSKILSTMITAVEPKPFITTSNQMGSSLNEKSNMFMSYNGSSSNQHVNQTEATKTTEGNGIVNAVKSFFSFLIKPIIDTKTLLVGTDSTSEKSTVATHSDKPQKIQSSYQSIYECQNNLSPILCRNDNCQNYGLHEKTRNIYMDFMPSELDNCTFFDCDDFLEGDEDTVDFVADSTKIQWNNNSFDEMAAIHSSPAKDNIFYDCDNHFVMESPKEKSTAITSRKNPNLSHNNDENSVSNMKQELIENEATRNNHSEMMISDRNSKQAYNNQIEINEIQCKCVQYTNNEMKMSPLSSNLKQSSSCEKSNENKNAFYRSSNRKTKRKRKTNKNNQNHSNRFEYRHKGTASNKNRHEKIRHELEMDIHDDINNCGFNTIIEDDEVDDVDDVNEPETDLEIIDMEQPIQLQKFDEKISHANEKIQSPEVIPSGCVFKYFFKWGSPKCKLSSFPLRFLRRRKLLHSHKSIEKSLAPLEPLPLQSNHQRITEAENDDNFIVFEDSSPRDEHFARQLTKQDTCRRQRQLSECSDDFIVFDDRFDEDNYLYNDTTDEDFSESTDDSDNDMEDYSDTGNFN